MRYAKHTARWRRQAMWRDPVPYDNILFLLLLFGVAIIPWLVVIYILWQR